MKKIIGDRPIDVLEISARVTHLLKKNGIKTVADLVYWMESDQTIYVRGMGEKSLNEIKEVLENVIVFEDKYQQELETTQDIQEDLENKFEIIQLDYRSLVLSSLDTLKKITQEQIRNGLLHGKVLIGDKELEHLLSLDIPDYPDLASALSLGLRSISAIQEIDSLLAGFSDRDMQILVERYGIETQTLEAISKKHGITRERVRQILQRQGNSINNFYQSISALIGYSHEHLPLLRTQTVLLVGKDLGTEISFDQWVEKVKMSGLLGDGFIKEDVIEEKIEILISVCNILYEQGHEEFYVPSNVQDAISLTAENLPGRSVKKLRIVENTSKEVHKAIDRHMRFSGGVHSRWLSLDLKYQLDDFEELLDALELSRADDNWFIPAVVDNDDEDLTRV